MLDIKFIKDNTEYVKERLKTRQKSYDAEIDELIGLDVERRSLKRLNRTKFQSPFRSLKKRARTLLPFSRK